MEADSVSLDFTADEKNIQPKLQVSNVKLIISLFIIFMVVVSEPFTNGVISGFGANAMLGRKITTWGTVLQGVFLIIFYILAIYLTENHIL